MPAILATFLSVKIFYNTATARYGFVCAYSNYAKETKVDVVYLGTINVERGGFTPPPQPFNCLE